MKILVLAGSGEFTDSMVETDRYLLSLISDPHVVVLPTAAGQEDTWQKWIDDGVKHFRKLGANVSGLFVLNRSDAMSEEFVKEMKNAGFIYFSGGEPGYLSSVLINSSLWTIIDKKYRKGAILAGSSAGAMVMGSYTLANGQGVFMAGEKPVWNKALGLIPYTIFPHFNWVKRHKKKEMDLVLSTAPIEVKNNWIGIDEDTALVIFDEKKGEVKGEGRVLVNKNGEEMEYKSKDTFDLST